MKIPVMGQLSRLLFRAGDAILFRPKGTFFTMQTKAKEDTKSRLFSFFRKRNTEEKILKFKNACAQASEQSFFLGLYRSLLQHIFSARMRQIGIAIFICGFLNALSYFASRFVPALPGTIDHFFLGLCMILIGLVASLERHSLGDILKKSIFYSKILCPLFGFEERDFPRQIRTRGWGMPLAAVIFGIFSVFTSPTIMFFALFSCFSVMLIFSKPENGLILFCLLFWALPSEWICIFLLLTLVSLIFKIMIGKRTLHFASPDLLFGIALIAVGAVSAIRGGNGAGRNYLLFASSLLLLFFGIHLIRTLQGLKRVFYALSLSLLLSSLGIMLDGILSLLPVKWQFLPLLQGLFSFEATKLSALPIAMLIPAALALSRSAEKAGDKLFAFLSAAAGLCALSFAGNGALWLASLIGILLFLLLSYRSTLYFSFAGVLLLLIGSFITPLQAQKAVLTFLGFDKWNFASIRAKWQAGAEAFFDALPLGSGFSNENLIASSQSGSFYFEVGILTGLAGLLLFLCLIALFLYQCFRFSKTTVREDIHPLVLAALCGTVIFLLLAFTGGGFDLRILSLFFLYTALPFSAARSCYREEVRLPY